MTGLGNSNIYPYMRVKGLKGLHGQRSVRVGRDKRVGLPLGTGTFPCRLKNVGPRMGKFLSGGFFPSKQVLDVTLKGLAGKADGIITKNLEEGRGCPQSHVPLRQGPWA